MHEQRITLFVQIARRSTGKALIAFRATPTLSERCIATEMLRDAAQQVEMRFPTIIVNESFQSSGLSGSRGFILFREAT
ncbi:hypothetical protein QTI66_16465 [Variovorax sp. J22R133]|uniref:hypothetical protein n=1 Tax=Variovorax brevis TaxID=3053503 RepID=UPI002578DAE7|nr:hypothetical protein [Variovorax sp. J22R133]MDM0113754.1 hypothetical protein [Variovorax sp. J22R133]